MHQSMWYINIYEHVISINCSLITPYMHNIKLIDTELELVECEIVFSFKKNSSLYTVHLCYATTSGLLKNVALEFEYFYIHLFIYRCDWSQSVLKT